MRCMSCVLSPSVSKITASALPYIGLDVKTSTWLNALVRSVCCVCMKFLSRAVGSSPNIRQETLACRSTPAFCHVCALYFLDVTRQWRDVYFAFRFPLRLDRAQVRRHQRVLAAAL